MWVSKPDSRHIGEESASEHALMMLNVLVILLHGEIMKLSPDPAHCPALDTAVYGKLHVIGGGGEMNDSAAHRNTYSFWICSKLSRLLPGEQM
jgi:hypothetical protein